MCVKEKERASVFILVCVSVCVWVCVWLFICQVFFAFVWLKYDLGGLGGVGGGGDVSFEERQIFGARASERIYKVLVYFLLNKHNFHLCIFRH